MVASISWHFKSHQVGCQFSKLLYHQIATSIGHLFMNPTSSFIVEPDSGIRLKYLAEGAANIIYRPVGSPPSPSVEADLDFMPDGTTTTPPPTEIQPLIVDPRLEGKLIRLRKDLSTSRPVTASWDHFHNVVSPLFPESQVVSQTLFRISPKVIKDLNVELRHMEKGGRRPSKRHATYLAEDEGYGTLVKDMSPDETSFSLELKPKWLVQSPSAPPESKRCRTCALRAMRQAPQQDHQEAEDTKSIFCPLRLASGDRSQVAVAVDQILNSPKYAELRSQHLQELIVAWILDSLLMKRLKQLQIELDPVGVLEADLMSENLLIAMTLRDCTLFLKVLYCDSYAEQQLMLVEHRYLVLVQRA